MRGQEGRPTPTYRASWSTVGACVVIRLNTVLGFTKLYNDQEIHHNLFIILLLGSIA